jgi:hypothetical protein
MGGTRGRTYMYDQGYTIFNLLSRPQMQIVATGSHKIVNCSSRLALMSACDASELIICFDPSPPH